MSFISKGRFIVILLAIIFLLAFSYYQNNSLTISPFTISFAELPEVFDGTRIVHLSDLHGKDFGKNQERLVKKIEKLKPDLILFTGDLIDRRRYNDEAALIFMEKAAQLAPVFYSTGNHEMWSGQFASLEKLLLQLEIGVLRNDIYIYERAGEKISIIGLDDPAFFKGQSQYINLLNDLGEQGKKNFTILLSHRPEFFNIYSKYKFNLIVSGHAHGGQVRLPFIGGLLAPDQGLFPRFTQGVHKKDESYMVVSRGLGNSSIAPQRVFNRPEIVVIELRKKQ